MKQADKLFLALVIFLVVSPLALAHETDALHEEVELPANIQGIRDYQNEQARFYLESLSFLIAFLAGVVGILTPCSLAILPAFFAYGFEGKKQITKKTMTFFLGFTPVFIIFGLLATFFGKTIAIFQQNNRILVTVAGIFIMLFGLMALFGRGFSGIQIRKKTDKSVLGVFLFGVFFAVGFTACMGPIIFGILLIAGVLQNYLYASFLMLSYSFGLFVPLFLISMLSDRYNFSRFMNNINKRLGFPLTNLISGGLLIAIGLVFIIYGGTFITGNLGLGSVTIFIYSIQNSLVSLKFINVIGALVLIVFLYLLWRFLRKEKTQNSG